MKRKIGFASIIASIVCFVGINNASALHIDFVDQSLFGAAQGQRSYRTTIQGVGFTVNAAPSPDATLTWNVGDGLGISSSYEYDEIESNEQLGVFFDNTVLLNSIDLTDFFVETRQGHTYSERGSITLYGDAFLDGYKIDIAAYSPTAGTNGEFSWFAGQALAVNRIVFEALGKVGIEDHEFSLAGLNISEASVPEPGTLVLLGVGLLAMLGYKRKMVRR